MSFKLVASIDEINALIKEGYVQPSLTGIHDYLLTLTSVGGKTKEIIVTTEESTVIKPKAKSDDNGHKTIESWINDWRRHWKGKGNQKAPMGVRAVCVSRMRDFFRMYPKYTKEHVYRARDKYFAHLDGNYTYMEKADNFISKQIINNEGGTTVRRTLLSYCEEVEMDDQFGDDTDSYGVFEDL